MRKFTSKLREDDVGVILYVIASSGRSLYALKLEVGTGGHYI